jgi:hypothetical protein
MTCLILEKPGSVGGGPVRVVVPHEAASPTTPTTAIVVRIRLRSTCQRWRGLLKVS